MCSQIISLCGQNLHLFRFFFDRSGAKITYYFNYHKCILQPQSIDSFRINNNQTIKKTGDLFTLIKLMYFRLFSYWYCNYTKLGIGSRCSVYGLCFKSLCTYITLFRSFLCRPCMIVRRRQNVLISRFREDVDTRQQFLFLFSEFRYSGS